jgi:formylglycine-generating enzyme required for sulfatase activity
MASHTVSTPNTSPSNGAEIEHYLEILEDALDECAYERSNAETGSPEAFLWHARRCLEAMVLALSHAPVEPTRQKALEEARRSNDGQPSIDALRRACKAANLTDRTIENLFQTLQSVGNIGVHVKGPGSEPKKHDLRSARSTLFIGIEWLFKTSPIQRDIPRRISDALASLESDIPRPSRVQQAIQAHEMRLAQQEELRQDFELRLRQTETESQILRERNQSLASSLAAQRRDLEAARAERRHPAAAGAAQPVLSRLFFVGVFLALGTGAALGAGAATWLGSSRSTRVEPLVTAMSSASVAASIEPSSRAQGDRARADDLDAHARRAANALLDRGAASAPADDTATLPAAQPTCPEGMTLLPAESLALGQPIGGRQDWPPASTRRLAPLEVAAFCVDRAPVSRASLDAWRLAARRAPASRCSGTERPDAPADCVSDEDANAYCAERSARLPRIAEWERIARADLLPTAPGLPEEWVSDTFPPAVFGRHGCSAHSARCNHRMIRGERLPAQRLPREPNVRYSWNAPNPQALVRPALGFRCAAAPSE